MTKKDYIIIAGAIKQISENPMLNLSEYQLNASIDILARALQKDNPRFNKDKFTQFINPHYRSPGLSNN